MYTDVIHANVCPYSCIAENFESSFRRRNDIGGGKLIRWLFAREYTDNLNWFLEPN